MEEHTGEITTSSVIDRDDVCPGQLVCLLEVDAIADCSTGFVIVKVKVSATSCLFQSGVEGSCYFVYYHCTIRA